MKISRLYKKGFICELLITTVKMLIVIARSNVWWKRNTKKLSNTTANQGPYEILESTELWAVSVKENKLGKCPNTALRSAFHWCWSWGFGDGPRQEHENCFSLGDSDTGRQTDSTVSTCLAEACWKNKTEAGRKQACMLYPRRGEIKVRGCTPLFSMTPQEPPICHILIK